MKSLWKQVYTSHGGAIAATLLTVLVLFPVWFWAGDWYEKDLIKEARAKTAGEISARANALTSAVNQRIALLQGLYAFTRTEWPDAQFDQPFEIYSAGLYFNSTGLRTLMIAPEGIARYIFPIADSKALSGYDILNDPDPETRADVQRAIHTRGIILSPPGPLRQGGFGVTAWEAVYRGQDLWGLVSIAVDMNTVLTDAGLTNSENGLNIALRNASSQTFFGPETLWQVDPVIQKIVLPDGAWELGGAPSDGWDSAVLPEMRVFRAGSMLILGLIAAMVYLTINRQSRLVQAVALRTRQIALAQKNAEERMQARTRELSTLLQVSRRVGSTLTLDPLLNQILVEMKPALEYTEAAIIRLDETGKLVVASRAGSPLAGDSEKPPFLVDETQIKQVITTLQPRIKPNLGINESSSDKSCWMGVPMVVKDQAIGVLILFLRDSECYREVDANLALAFGQLAAIAMEKARLYEQAGQLAVLEERQRLARELHDSVSQVLYSIGLGAKTARAALERNPSQLADALDYVNRLAEAGQVEMRSLIFELRPESLRIDGLVVALEKQVAVLRTRHQLMVDEHFCLEPKVQLVTKEALYRVSQETIHNIIKHAHATQVTLSLECDENQVRLEIRDNGIGFDPSADFPGHFGLQSMRERAAQSKGQIKINSTRGSGTQVQFTVPIQ